MILLKSILLLLTHLGCYVSADTTYHCDFENGLCPFLMNDEGNDVNWTTGIPETGSFGPWFDHTFRNESRSFLFVDVNTAEWKPVNLQTVDLTKDYCVRFFYYMNGERIGELEAYVQSLYNKNHTKGYFFRREAQGFRWKEVAFQVSGQGTYRVVFSVKQFGASNSSGTIALDDIELTPGKCPDNKNMAEKICSFDNYDCGYALTSSKYSFRWRWQAEGRKTYEFDGKPRTDHTLGTSAGGYWFAETTSESFLQEVTMTTPTYYKASENSVGCLQFCYYMESSPSTIWNPGLKQTKAAFLDTHIVNLGKRRTLVLNIKMNDTNDKGWTFIETEANLSSEYRLEFTVGIETRVPVVIAIDDVQVLPGECPQVNPCSPNPCLNDGSCEVVARSASCKCVPGYEGEFCEIVPCIPNPCLNNGSCEMVSGNVSCDCLPGYDGEKCEIDPCIPNPCLNNGSCEVVGGNVSCSCVPGYEGERCEIDPCIPNPCLNNGSCEVSDGNVSCSCVPGYEGQRCEIDLCFPNPCMNNGSCEVAGGNFSCNCLPGYEGSKCEIDFCDPNPCHNGTCVYVGKYLNCTCDEFSSGEFCENTPCSSSPCINGGKCTNINREDFLCKCRYGYIGEICEKRRILIDVKLQIDIS